ncbi:hypothetical protein DITRI_Ditri17bG0020400 [Diplodiscus trichospermus]
MGKLYSSISLALSSLIVHHNKTHSCFHSSFSCPFTTFTTYSKALGKNSASVKGTRKQHDSFYNVDDALTLFNRMVQKYFSPFVVEFNKLLSAIVRMKYYAIVVSLHSQIELLGVSHNGYSLNILINCFFGLNQVGFRFSILGKRLKLGIDPTIVTFSTLINGFCTQSKVAQAVSLFDETIQKGLLFRMILNGLCKTRDIDRAIKLFRMMEERGLQPNIVAYNTLIDCLCKDKRLTEVFDLFSKEKDKGLSPTTTTYNCLIHAMCILGKEMDAKKFLDEMLASNVSLDVVTFNILVDAHCKEGMVYEAKDIVNTRIKAWH